MTSPPTTRNARQRMLLRLYALTRSTGVLETSFGRHVFEWAYDIYKRWSEATDAEALQAFVTPGTLVIDVGANIGFFTTRFARWVSSGGRVLAVEPEATNLTRLRRTLVDRNIPSVVDVIAAAATERPGPVRLEISKDHPGDHRLAAVGQPNVGVTVDGLVGERGWIPVSLIKIDVQGAETAVVRGAREVLKRFTPALYIEVDDNALANFGSSASELCSVLAGFGYAPHRCRPGAPVRLNPEEVLSAAKETYLDVLFLQQGPHG